MFVNFYFVFLPVGILVLAIILTGVAIYLYKKSRTETQNIISEFDEKIKDFYLMKFDFKAFPEEFKLVPIVKSKINYLESLQQTKKSNHNEIDIQFGEEQLFETNAQIKKSDKGIHKLESPDFSELFEGKNVSDLLKKY